MDRTFLNIFAIDLGPYSAYDRRTFVNILNTHTA